MKTTFYLLIAFQLLFHRVTCLAQEDARQKYISPVIGDSLDERERDFYKLFPNLKDFVGAVFYLEDNNSLSAKVYFQDDHQLKFNMYENYMAGLQNFNHYTEQIDKVSATTPAGKEITFNSINKIEYSVYEVQNGSDNSGTPSRFGGEANWRNGELTIGILNQLQIGIYRMVVKVNTTFLPDGGSTRISSSALYTLGYMFAASLAMGTIHREDVGEKGQTVYALILGSPLLLTNAEHHLFIVNPPGNYQTDPFALSSFVAFRTDYFGPEWIVYSTDVGLQFEFNRKNEDGYTFGNSMAVKIGNEFTYDGKKGDFWTTRLFLAGEITF